MSKIDVYDDKTSDGEMIDDDDFEELYGPIKGVDRERRRQNKQKMKVDGAGLRDTARRMQNEHNRGG